MWCQVDSWYLPLPLFCGVSLSLCSPLLPPLHTPSLFYLLLSVSSLCLASYSYMPSPLLAFIVASLRWEQEQGKQNVNCCHRIQGVDEDTNLLYQERWEWHKVEWLQAVFKGLEGRRLKLDSQSYLFLWQQHGGPLNIIWCSHCCVKGCAVNFFFSNKLWHFKFLFWVLLYCFVALVSWLSWPSFQVVPSL